MDYPTIAAVVYDCDVQLFAGVHRYGSGWGVALLPAHQADLYHHLMDASGSEAFIFSYAAHGVPELPFVFAPTLGEAMAMLEERLQGPKGSVHHPKHYLEHLMGAVSNEDNTGNPWPAVYRAAYAEYMEGWHGGTPKGEHAVDARTWQRSIGISLDDLRDDSVAFAFTAPMAPNLVWQGSREAGALPVGETLPVSMSIATDASAARSAVGGLHQALMQFGKAYGAPIARKPGKKHKKRK